MLEVGCDHGPGGDSDKGLSEEETRTHFGAWCIVSSPLTLSMDVNNDTIMDSVWDLISNKEAIAVNQAWYGHPGGPYSASDTNVTLNDGSVVPSLQVKSYKSCSDDRTRHDFRTSTCILGALLVCAVCYVSSDTSETFLRRKHP